MMKERVYRTVRYQLYPSAVQHTALIYTLDGCRQVYNYLNQECINRKRFGRPIPSFYEMEHLITELKGIAPELYDVHSKCLIDVASRVDIAYRTILKHNPFAKENQIDEQIEIESIYDDGKNGRTSDDDDNRSRRYHRKGNVRFRGKGRYDSFTYNQDGFWFVGNRLHLSPIGDIRYRNSKKINGVMKSCTVKRNAKGEWFASVTYEPEIIGKGIFSLDRPYSPVGIDLGLKNIATLSDSTVYVNSRKFEKMIAVISRLQRRMSVLADIIHDVRSSNTDRKIPDIYERYSGYSKEALRRELDKLRMKFDRIFVRFNDIRKGEYNRITAELIKNYDAIAIEDIDIRRIIDKQTTKGMRRSFSGAAWGIFTGMLIQKAECAAVPVIKVDPYNTSRRCSHCGNTKPNMSLSHRTYYCIECGHVCDRDINAALNILKGSGLRTFLHGEPEVRTS